MPRLIALSALAIALAIAIVSPVRAGLIGVTNTHLVNIDPVNPGQITTIGAINLPTGITPYALTYDTDSRRLFGLGIASAPTVTSYLLEFNLLTGQGNVLANLGPQSVGFYESLEDVASLSSLVASRDTTGSPSDQLFRIGPSGTASLLVSTPGRDNDFAVYDSLRDIFYTTDPNGVGQLVRVDVATGATTDLGGIPSPLGELAFSRDSGFIYGISYTGNNFYRIGTTSGGSPISATLVGTTGNLQLQGIAYIPAAAVAVPEPASVVLFGLGGLGLLGVARRRARVGYVSG